MENCLNKDIFESTKLQNPDNIENGYSSIEELFSKISKITDLQSEPNYPPIFRGETFPTYIIVGDIHGGEYIFSKEMLQVLKQEFGCKYIIDDNEGPEKEIKAIEILNNKFGIDTIGLENEYSDGQYWGSLIGIGLSKISGLNLLGLENEKISKKMDLAMFLPLVILRRELISNINDYNNTSNENELANYESFNIDTLSISALNLSNLNKKQLIYLLSSLLKEVELLGISIEHNDLNILEGNVLNFVKNEGIDIKSISFTNLEKISEQLSLKYSEKRETIGVNYISDLKTPQKAPKVMIYGKAHIPGLIKGLNKKYDGKVNIYIAK